MTERKMHWVSWKKLCLPKSFGGMSFRDPKIFNQALLAKQGWRLLCDNTSLVYKVLSARYFKNGTFLEDLRGYDPSFVWRSIWGAKALLLEGLKWRVGDGTKIRVWDKAWLPSEDVSKVPTPNIESPTALCVTDLIDIEGGWNDDALNFQFTAHDGMMLA